ncbi:hypothetical protein [Azospirillum doebereinerae]
MGGDQALAALRVAAPVHTDAAQATEAAGAATRTLALFTANRTG